MAGRTTNRLELRRQYDAAEPLDPVEDESEEIIDSEDEPSPRRKKAAKAPAKSKAKSAKPAKPAARNRIVWAVVNDAYKTIATFEYSQREQAETKAREMTEKGKGAHFVQKVKEPMPDNAPGLGASIPRSELAAPPAAKPVDSTADEEEEAEEEEEEEEEEEDDYDDED